MSQSMTQSFKRFSEREHATWRSLYEAQRPRRDEQVIEAFGQGLDALGITAERIPDLDDVSRRLSARTGFEGVPVAGLEEPAEFFRMLAARRFPIGNFIREPEDLAYTPAPDVFHDLYGHLPFLADAAYADFCARFGRVASVHAGNAEAIRQFDRLFWFGIEFGLIRTPRGNRIFGAGIASSHRECAYALSDAPEVLAFDLERIRRQEFRIDELQPRLFLLEDAEQLYRCLPAFEEGLPNPGENP